MGGVGEDHAVEAQLIPQQALEQLGRQGGGHNVLILDAGVDGPGPGGLHDVSGHDGLQALVDQALVHLAVCIHPGIAVGAVDAGREMLVPLVQAVSGEVFGGAGKAGVLMGALEIGLGHAADRVGVIGEAPRGDHRIAPVLVDVGQRGEAQVAADGGSLLVGDAPQLIGVLLISGGSNLHRVAQEGSVGAGAVAAGLGVAGNEQRDLGVLLQNVILLPDLVGGTGVIAHAANVVFLHRHAQVVLLPGGSHVEKELSNLFLYTHAGDGVFYPFHTLIIQKKWLCSQIYHGFLHSFFSQFG